MTEQEANTKWCPLSQTGHYRGGDGNIRHAFCIGSACMAWRWSIVNRHFVLAEDRAATEEPPRPAHVFAEHVWMPYDPRTADPPDGSRRATAIAALPAPPPDTEEDDMPDTIATSERAQRLDLAGKLRFAAECLERDGINSVRLYTAKDVCLAALNDLDRALDYGNPGAGIDALLGGPQCLT